VTAPEQGRADGAVTCSSTARHSAVSWRGAPWGLYYCLVDKTTYTVFTVTNARRREIFVGLTPFSLHETLSRMRRALPAELEGWEARDLTDYCGLEFGLSAEEARRRVEECASSSHEGLRCIAAREPQPA
jgi:hypothetical protein